MNVKRLRGLAKISQGDLARMAGVSRSAVSDCELGTIAIPDMATIEALARALGVTSVYLQTPFAHDAPPNRYVAEFLASHWREALRPTDAEITWLSALPDIVYYGAQPTGYTIARILMLHRELQKEGNSQ